MLGNTHLKVVGDGNIFADELRIENALDAVPLYIPDNFLGML